MSVKKISNWMVTDYGKGLVYFSVCGISTATILVHYLPNTILIDKYQEIIQLYKDGFSVKVSNELENRFQKVLQLLKIDNQLKQLYKPFHVYGFDVTSAGSSYSKFGCIIGIPLNFTYNNTDAIDRSKIRVNQETVVWETEEAKSLLSSLILSENAQLYAMAREIKYRQTLKPMVDAFLSLNLVFMSYGISKHLNEKFNFYSKPRAFRFILYSFVGLFSLGFYVMSTDASQIYYEEKIDKELKQTDTLFIEGGREYYGKELERNKALRFLLGKEGERLYSVLGNENYFLRQRHLPLLQRKSQFEEQMSS